MRTQSGTSEMSGREDAENNVLKEKEIKDTSRIKNERV